MRLPCRDNPTGWFPPEGQETATWYNFSAKAEEAKFLCHTQCPMGAENCLKQFGAIEHGIVGGLTPTERVIYGWR